MLGSLESASPEELLRNWQDGRIKLLLTQRLLRLRRGNPLLFERGDYLPVNVSGEFADCCIPFARRHEGKWVAVIVPRLSSRVGFPPIGEKWKDTAVELPESISLEGATEIFSTAKLSDRNLRLADAMEVLPFAVYTSQGAAISKSPT
jgi:(1->4)-alpha-D-glucan 1-alpha-D-glucosylmutase